MTDDMTVAEVLERVRERRRQKQCPDCSSVVSVRGFRGEYRWECHGCGALGIGYRTRAGALEAVQQRRRRNRR